MQPNEITKRFNSHDVSREQAKDIDLIRALFLDLGQRLASILPEGREESVALTHLETASFFAIAAIAREDK